MRGIAPAVCPSAFVAPGAAVESAATAGTLCVERSRCVSRSFGRAPRSLTRRAASAALYLSSSIDDRRHPVLHRECGETPHPRSVTRKGEPAICDVLAHHECNTESSSEPARRGHPPLLFRSVARGARGAASASGERSAAPAEAEAAGPSPRRVATVRVADSRATWLGPDIGLRVPGHGRPSAPLFSCNRTLRSELGLPPAQTRAAVARRPHIG